MKGAGRGQPPVDPMNVKETDLPGCLLIEPRVFGDERGYFYEQWNAARYRDAGLDLQFVQSNVSASGHGVLRGLHYQWPNPQGKLVSVLDGEVWDVAVDIRRGSPHYGRWTAAILSGGNKRQLWIPEGFAHGFVTLTEEAEFLYKTTGYYAPDCEGSIVWDDPALGIEWPIDRAAVKLSGKDPMHRPSRRRNFSTDRPCASGGQDS